MTIEYVGPYNGIAYDIANQWAANGGERTMVGPYAPEYYDAANAIMDAQPSAQQQVQNTGAGTAAAPAPAPAPAAPVKVLNQAAVDNTNKAITSLDTEKQVGYQNIEDDYNRVMGQYDLEKGQNRTDFDEGIVTNNRNLQKNRQNALVTAAQGLRGLRGVLSSIGALSGDGARLANTAVTTEANQDLGGAQEVAAANAMGLNRAWDRFGEEDEQRRADAQTSRTNSRTALEGSIAGKRQGLLQQLAELFGDVDNTTEAKKYLDQAGDLNAEIAQKSRVQASPITSKAAAFSPGELETYLAGAGDLSINVQNDAPNVGGSTAVLAGRDGGRDDERRKRLEFATV